MSLLLWGAECVCGGEAFLPKEVTDGPKGDMLGTVGLLKKGLCGLSITSKPENRRQWDWKGSQSISCRVL